MKAKDLTVAESILALLTDVSSYYLVCTSLKFGAFNQVAHYL